MGKYSLVSSWENYYYYYYYHWWKSFSLAMQFLFNVMENCLEDDRKWMAIKFKIKEKRTDYHSSKFIENHHSEMIWYDEKWQNSYVRLCVISIFFRNYTYIAVYLNRNCATCKNNHCSLAMFFSNRKSLSFRSSNAIKSTCVKCVY